MGLGGEERGLGGSGGDSSGAGAARAGRRSRGSAAAGLRSPGRVTAGGRGEPGLPGLPDTAGCSGRVPGRSSVSPHTSPTSSPWAKRAAPVAPAHASPAGWQGRALPAGLGARERFPLIPPAATSQDTGTAVRSRTHALPAPLPVHGQLCQTEPTRTQPCPGPQDGHRGPHPAPAQTRELLRHSGVGTGAPQPGLGTHTRAESQLCHQPRHTHQLPAQGSWGTSAARG